MQETKHQGYQMAIYLRLMTITLLDFGITLLSQSQLLHLGKGFDLVH
jgi:hypothetical protein